MLLRPTFLIALTPLLLTTRPARGAGCPPVSHISIGSGSFSSRPGVTFLLRHFVATLQPMGRTAPACFEKVTVLTRGEIFVSNESLTNVFAGKLGASNSGIQDLRIVNGTGKVTLTGKLKKLIPVDFTIEGPVTTDGVVLLVDASKIKADGIPVKTLLSVLGQHLSSVLSVHGVSGVVVRENQLTFAPEQIAHLRGHIDSVKTTSDGLTLRYTSLAAKRR